MTTNAHPFPKSATEARNIIRGQGKAIEEKIAEIYRRSEKSVEALKSAPHNSKGSIILTAVVATAAVLGVGIFIAKSNGLKSWQQLAEESKNRDSAKSYTR